MRILLLSTNVFSEPYAVYPLGMSVIAGALTDAGHEVRQFDPMLCGNGKCYEKLSELLQEFHPDAIGVSIRNLDNMDSSDESEPLIHDSIETIRHLRALSSAPVILGGSGFSLQPEAILRLTGADYGIVGEGEEAVVRLFSRLSHGEIVTEKLHYACTEKQFGAVYQEDILDYYNKESNSIPLQTKRGCAFNCIYCTYPMLEGHCVRMRDPEEVVSEIITLHQRFPDAMLYLVDAVFNDPGKQYLKLLELMLRRNVVVPWSAFITPEQLEEEEIKLMAATGMTAVDLGVDASTDATLAGMGKKFTFSNIPQICRTILKLDVEVTASVMFGGPGETEKTVMEGIANLRSLEPVYSIIFSGIRILTGTPLLDLAKKQGIVPPDWDGIRKLFYYAPGLSPEWLDQTLKSGFGGSKYCIYPPGSRNVQLRKIHRFGYVKLKKMQLTKGSL
jgi:radical SAM superfamily enzyme YgiQ (UPF0313 family)